MLRVNDQLIVNAMHITALTQAGNQTFTEMQAV